MNKSLHSPNSAGAYIKRLFCGRDVWLALSCSGTALRRLDCFDHFIKGRHFLEILQSCSSPHSKPNRTTLSMNGPQLRHGMNPRGLRRSRSKRSSRSFDQNAGSKRDQRSKVWGSARSPTTALSAAEDSGVCNFRSEERRVGKECRSRGSAEH